MIKKSFNITKISRRSADVLAADILRRGILFGSILLGARLKEVILSESLCVSRSTIRRAFDRLAYEGLVFHTSHIGWSVMTMSSVDAWDLHTLRAGLEALSVRLVTQRVIEEGLGGGAYLMIMNSLESYVDICKTNDQRDIAMADMVFRQTIVERTGHSRLIDQYARICYPLLIYAQHISVSVSMSDATSARYLSLTESIASGDVDLAVQSVTQHNDLVGAVLITHLQNSLDT